MDNAHLVFQLNQENVKKYEDVELEIGKWYFTDETYELVGPYDSEEAANEALEKYKLYIG